MLLLGSVYYFYRSDDAIYTTKIHLRGNCNAASADTWTSKSTHTTITNMAGLHDLSSSVRPFTYDNPKPV